MDGFADDGRLRLADSGRLPRLLRVAVLLFLGAPAGTLVLTAFPGVVGAALRAGPVVD